MKITKFCFLLFLLFAWGCERQTLVDACKHRTALIPVKINWELSGIDPQSGLADDFVHRVSFRFFPKNGDLPFEVYLEGNVCEGTIEVPTGIYDVVVMNESVMDIFWQGSVYFRNINEFDRMYVEVCPDNPAPYEFYEPQSGEQFMTDIPKMASWTIRNYEVTDQTIEETRNPDFASKAPAHTLTVPLLRLTHDCRVVATVKHLRSAQLVRAAKRGFANKIFLSTRITLNAPATYLFTFNGRKPLPGSQTDGTTEKTFRTLGALPRLSEHFLNVDVILVDGRRYIPDHPSLMIFDVAKHIYDYFSKPLPEVINRKIEIPISFSIPETAGDIGVGDWGDDENITIQ